VLSVGPEHWAWEAQGAVRSHQHLWFSVGAAALVVLRCCHELPALTFPSLSICYSEVVVVSAAF
jgi:hypothetical protein